MGTGALRRAMASAGWHGHESDATRLRCSVPSRLLFARPRSERRQPSPRLARHVEQGPPDEDGSATYPATIATERASSASREISPKPSLATSFAFMAPDAKGVAQALRRHGADAARSVAAPTARPAAARSRPGVRGMRPNSISAAG